MATNVRMSLYFAQLQAVPVNNPSAKFELTNEGVEAAVQYCTKNNIEFSKANDGELKQVWALFVTKPGCGREAQK